MPSIRRAGAARAPTGRSSVGPPRRGAAAGAAARDAGRGPPSSSARWASRCRRRARASSIIAASRARLRLERLDLALDPLAWRRSRIARRSAGSPVVAEALAVALAGGLVLEQLADLGQREPGVVAQAADEAQALEVGGVVQAVVAVRPGGGLEQADLLVVADRPGRQAGLGGDLLDPQEGGVRREAFGHGLMDIPPTIPQP